ncbi:MAG TPA: LPS export ABC transporter permease LptF [Nitrospirae bacterium]|nr:LPS export ABC transporter permease LptF [Nitrospirota bacterium]
METMIIRKTIFKELLLNFAIVISFLSFVLFMEKFVRLSRVVMGKGAAFTDVLKLFLYLQPSFMLLSIPVAILIAVFLTYGRMSTDNETIVLKSSGMSLWAISRPAIVISIAGFVILFLISIYVLPKSILSFKRTVYETIAKKASIAIEEESFITVFKGMVVYIKEMSSGNRFRGIFVYREGDTKEPLVIVAEEGAIRANPAEGIINLSMRNGIIHTFSENSSSEAEFDEYDFVLTAEIEPHRELKLNERGIIDLWKGRNRTVYWAVELNRRLALPFACLIFGLLGPALSTRIGKTGRLGAFSFSLSVLILYYVLFILGEGLAKAKKISPFWGGWLPTIVFGVIAVLCFYLACRDWPVFKRKAG